MQLVTPAHENGNAVLVTVYETQGSAPRDKGTWMLVLRDGIEGTIGGGQLEFDAIARAREWLARLEAATAVNAPLKDEGVERKPFEQRYALGPSLGQCCGGVVHLRFEYIAASQRAALAPRLQPQLAPLALFGGGHVGRALVNVLATLPFDITWIDSRDEVFPAGLPPNVQTEHSDPVQGAVPQLASGSRVLVMSFSHAEDLDIVAACLQRLRERDDLPYIGLIGSKSKWAAFRHRLEARGFTDSELARITCPIGLPGIAGKQPEVIAVSVAAQLLQQTPLNR